MDQTDIWMLGVGGFGVVFYLFSLYYRKVEDSDHSSPETKSD